MNALTIGSVFSGVAGLELGLEAAGHGPVMWQVEVDKFCRSVLGHRYPDTRQIPLVEFATGETLQPVDLVCGGFPCQDVSAVG